MSTVRISPVRRPAARAIALAALASFAGFDADAAVFCVDTATELRNALNTAAANGQADTIQIVEGVYSVGSGAVAFPYFTNESEDLALVGGYLAGTSPPCASPSLRPELTVLSGSNARVTLQLFGGPGTSGNLSVATLTVRDGFSTTGAAGVFLGGGNTFSGNIAVNRTIITRNITSADTGGLKVATNGGTVAVRNNLLLLNRCGTTFCAMNVTVNAPTAVSYRGFVSENTVVFNQCASGTSCDDTGARVGGSARIVVHNNAFAGNTVGDLDLGSFGGGSVDLYSNNLVTLTGTPPTNEAGTLNFANPGFVDILDDDFRLRFTSPLRNAGNNGFPKLAVDLAARPRVNEGVIDIGAYENHEVVFVNQFEPAP